MKYKGFTVFAMPYGDETINMMTLTDVKYLVEEAKEGCKHCKCNCIRCDVCGDK